MRGMEVVSEAINLMGICLLIVIANTILMFELGVGPSVLSDISLFLLVVLFAPLGADSISKR